MELCEFPKGHMKSFHIVILYRPSVRPAVWLNAS